jgi:hypothetical protein
MRSEYGKNFNSKFRMNRHARENAVDDGMKQEKESHPQQKDAGARSQAASIEAKPAANKSEAQKPEPEGQSGQAAGLAAQHGPASEVHITHDHANGKHHVHSIHADGHENHSDHATVDEAHFAGAAAGGINPEGNYNQDHHSPEGDEPDADDYDVEPL